MSLQLYGRFCDWTSFSNVSRALSYVLRTHHVNTSVYEIGTLNPHYLDAYNQVGLNNTAKIGVCVSYPEGSLDWLNGHDFKVLITVCETDRVPQSWVDSCNKVDLVVVPSQWCYDAFRRSGVTSEIIVVNHGVWRTGWTEYKTKHPLRFLHVSGSLSFAERKGTAKLLYAFKNFLKENSEAEFWLKLPPTQGVMDAIRYTGIPWKNIKLLTGPSSTPLEMENLFSQVDAVVQPSRAEGFGLVPLEAKCLGVLPILTNATGHTEHTKGVYVSIDTGSLELLETQANPVGSAPTVSISDIEVALNYYKEYKESFDFQAKLWAKNHANEWLWPNVLNSLITRLKKMDSKDRNIVLGGSASLRGVK